MTQTERYFELYNKTDDFTADDVSFLRSYIRRQRITVSYSFYKKDSAMDKQVALIFDLMPKQTRRSGVENIWEIFCSRIITEREIEEFITHYFQKSYKRFLVFYYSNVDKLMHDDKRLNAETPNAFVDECRKRGYSGTFQFKMELQ